MTASSKTRAARRRAQAEWRAMMTALNEDGGGAYAIEIIFPTANQLHPRSVSAVMQWIAAVKSGELVRPLCLDCDFEFALDALPAAFLMITAARGDPSVLTLTGICHSCAARSHDELIETAIRRARTIWPDARRLPAAHMNSTGGRA